MARHRIRRHWYPEELEERRLLAVTPDASFGTAGVTTLPVVVDRDDLSNGMRIQPWDGKVVMVGDTFVTDLETNDADFALTRLTNAGAADPTFGTAGVVITKMGFFVDHLANIDFQMLGANAHKIVVAGYTQTSGNDLSFVSTTTGDNVVTSRARLFTAVDIGQTITVLGGDGWLTGDYEITGVDGAGGAIIDGQAGADITAVQGQWSMDTVDFVVARYTEDGDLDTTFGTGQTGVVIMPVGSGNDFGFAVRVQPWDDKIVVAGYSEFNGNYDFSLIRLNQNGTLDTAGFNNVPTTTSPYQGKMLIGFSGDDFANTLDFNMANQHIIVAGSSGGATRGNLAFADLLPTGALSSTFGTNGKFTLALPGSSHEFINSVKVFQSGPNIGKIIGVGTQFQSSANYIPVIVQLTAAGATDSAFGTGGVVTANLGGRRDWGNSIIVDSNHRVVIAGSTQFASNNYDVYLMRFDPDGSADDTFNSGSNRIVKSVSTGNDYGATIDIDTSALASRGRIVVAGSTLNSITTPSEYNFLALAYTGDATGPLPVLNVGDIVIVEGDSGTKTATFTLLLSGPAATTVTVKYATADGTAIAGVDYSAKNGTVTFSAGQTSKTVTVPVKGNTIYQPSRVASLVLSNVQNATLSDAQARLEIRDNDGTWQNVDDPIDVNQDSAIEPLDALVVIDDLKRHGVRQLSQATSTPSFFFDVDGDTLATASDVLIIIDYLKRNLRPIAISDAAMSDDSPDANANAVASGLAATARTTQWGGEAPIVMNGYVSAGALNPLAAAATRSASTTTAAVDNALSSDPEQESDLDDELYDLIATETAL